MKKRLLSAVLMISAAALFPPLGAEEIAVDFGKGKWDPSKWIRVKSPRFDYLGEMVQNGDHIANQTPDLPDDVIFQKHGSKVYSCIMLDKRFSGSADISSTMSFDHRMAPLVVIAEEIGKSASGVPEHREHWEIVLYDKGLNVWHHTWENGKASYRKAAFLTADFQPGKRYTLKVGIMKKGGNTQMTVECGGRRFGFQDNRIPGSFLAGVIGCEGRNRFYDFKVKTFPAKEKKPSGKK